MTDNTNPANTDPAAVPTDDLINGDPSQHGDIKENAAPAAPEARAPKAQEPADTLDKSADAPKDDADKTPESEEPKELDTSVWGDTGSEEGNAALQLLQDSGITTDEAKALLYDATIKGDITLIDKAALEAKVGKAAATLIVAGVSNVIAQNEAQTKAILSTVHETVGGAENWQAIADWAKTGVDDKELDQYRTMIDAGGVQAKLAAQGLRDLYNSAEGNDTLGTEAVAPAQRATPVTTPPMSKIDYAQALDKAYREHNGQLPEALRRQLYDARQRGLAAGLR